MKSDTAQRDINVETLRGNISLYFQEKVLQEQTETNNDGGN